MYTEDNDQNCKGEQDDCLALNENERYFIDGIVAGPVQYSAGLPDYWSQSRFGPEETEDAPRASRPHRSLSTLAHPFRNNHQDHDPGKGGPSAAP